MIHIYIYLLCCRPGDRCVPELIVDPCVQYDAELELVCPENNVDLRPGRDHDTWSIRVLIASHRSLSPIVHKCKDI